MKIVARLFAALSLLTSCAFAGANTLPWTTYSAMARESVGAAPFACSNDDREGVTAVIEHDGKTYRFFALVDVAGAGSFVLAEFGEGELPERIYVGHSNADRHDVMVVDRVEPFDPAKHGRGACSVLAPDRA